MFAFALLGLYRVLILLSEAARDLTERSGGNGVSHLGACRPTTDKARNGFADELSETLRFELLASEVSDELIGGYFQGRAVNTSAEPLIGELDPRLHRDHAIAIGAHVDRPWHLRVAQKFQQRLTLNSH